MTKNGGCGWVVEAWSDFFVLIFLVTFLYQDKKVTHTVD